MVLYNGLEIPDKGAGTYSYKEELVQGIPEMVKIGYRLFDTSDNYHNEEYLGRGLTQVSGDILDGITVVTKFSDPRLSVRRSFEKSKKKLFPGSDRAQDVYLMHWPYPFMWEKLWRDFENLYMEGKCKAIGVCNFNEEKLEQILSICRIKPMINQIECHPMFQQRGILDICDREGIQVMSYSPLARINSELYENELLQTISQAHNKSISQIILNWNISEGRIPIPATCTSSHMEENYSVSDFQLSLEEMSLIDSLERGMRIRFDPDTRFTFAHKVFCFFRSFTI